MIFRWFFGDWVVKLLKFTKHNYNRLNIGDLPRRVWHLWQQKDKNSCDARVRVRARKGNYRYFHTSDSRYPFVPSSMRFFHSQTSIENDTSVVKKRHVVFKETTRREKWKSKITHQFDLLCNTLISWLWAFRGRSPPANTVAHCIRVTSTLFFEKFRMTSKADKVDSHIPNFRFF